MALAEEDSRGELHIHKDNFLVSGSNTREKSVQPRVTWDIAN